MTLPRIHVSENRRFLVTENGEPFFWLGDTAWELFHRLNLAESEHYLEVRRRQGFNVIQAVVLAELDGLRTPNANGHVPLCGDDPTRPNEYYFRHVDAVIHMAAEKGLYIGLAEAAGAEFDSRMRSVCPLPGHLGDRSSRAFSIYDNGRRWKCHSSCPPDASSGDVIAFYMAWKEVDFKTAIQELGGDAPEHATPALAPVSPALSTPQPPAQAWRERAEQFIAWAEANLDKHPGALAYLEKERGLSPETIRAFRLGYNPTNLYDDPARWGLDGKKIWLPRGIVIPGFWQKEPSYIKVRRPLAGDALGGYIGAWTPKDGLADVKFGGPRGGVSCLFRLELIGHLPVLFLVEGEWDAMLVWEYSPDLCDTATLGGAASKLDLLDLSLLTRYAAIIAVYDDDAAGDKGRAYLAELQKKIPRIQVIPPPAHDLTDFWKSGGSLRTWLAAQVAGALESASDGLCVPEA